MAASGRLRPAETLSMAFNLTEIRILGSKIEPLRTLVAAAGVESAAADVRSLYRNGAPDEIRTPNLLIRS
jgi:hypothetical protein